MGAQRRQPAAPTCGSGGPARPAHCRHSHIRGHTVCISKISTDTGAPENSLRPQGFGEGPARCFQYYILAGTQRLLEKPPGPWPPASWGGSQNPSWRSLTLEPARLPTYRPHPPGQRRKLSPGTAAGAPWPWKYIPGTWRRQRRSYRNPGSPVWVWVFPAQIHSQVR